MLSRTESSVAELRWQLAALFSYRMVAGLCLFGSLCLMQLAGASLIKDESKAAEWFRWYNEEAQRVYHQSSEASFNLATDMTPEHQRIAALMRQRLAKFTKSASQAAKQFDFRHFKNDLLRRAFSIVASMGGSILPPKEYKEFQRLSIDMENIYSSSKICNDGGQPLHLDPELTDIMAKSRSYDELLWAWKGWRDAVGPPMRAKYERFVELLNKAARLQNLTDASVSWRGAFSHDGKPPYKFEDDINNIFNVLKPMFVKMHRFVRRKLKQFYGAEHFPSSGHIPAHLLGNMWGQTWSNIEDLLIPKNVTDRIDITPSLENMTVHNMFKISEDFFTSLGLPSLPDIFWKKSMFVRPKGKEVVCHGSASDLRNGRDFRIKMCTTKTYDQFITIHHEMGHVEYYLMYKDLPLVFRRGANSGFHEAIGDLITLSVSNPRHLKRIGFLKNVTMTQETDNAFLLRLALYKLALVPFSKLIDDWRWSVFNGTISPADYNKSWWKLRCKYQGLSPPVIRSEHDFDPGAKYHIPSNTPYVRYFVAVVLQFQFHRSLCKAAGHVGPLHMCDLYGSKEAGAKLSNMLRYGGIKRWHKALKMVTGSESMDPSAIVEYFQPLMDWLDTQVDPSDDEPEGWDDECQAPPAVQVPPAACPPSTTRRRHRRSSYQEPAFAHAEWDADGLQLFEERP